MAGSLDDLEERIDRVDRFYSEQMKRIDDFYGERIDHLIERCNALESQLASVASQLRVLEARSNS